MPLPQSAIVRLPDPAANPTPERSSPTSEIPLAEFPEMVRSCTRIVFAVALKTCSAAASAIPPLPPNPPPAYWISTKPNADVVSA